jgi:hypothetical protein
MRGLGLRARAGSQDGHTTLAAKTGSPTPAAKTGSDGSRKRKKRARHKHRYRKPNTDPSTLQVAAESVASTLQAAGAHAAGGGKK